MSYQYNLYLKSVTHSCFVGFTSHHQTFLEQRTQKSLELRFRKELPLHIKIHSKCIHMYRGFYSECLTYKTCVKTKYQIFHTYCTSIKKGTAIQDMKQAVPVLYRQHRGHVWYTTVLGFTYRLFHCKRSLKVFCWWFWRILKNSINSPPVLILSN